jgi:VanZ family protein
MIRMAAKRTLLRLLPTVAYVLIIFFFSSQPYLRAPGPEFEAKDKVAHFFEYLGLGVLLFRSIGWSASRGKFTNFVFLWAVGVSIAALDEIFQSYIPGRTMSIFDWFADAAGLAAGLSVFMFTALGRRRRTAA